MYILDDMGVSKLSAKVFFQKWTTPLKEMDSNKMCRVAACFSILRFTRLGLLMYNSFTAINKPALEKNDCVNVTPGWPVPKAKLITLNTRQDTSCKLREVRDRNLRQLWHVFFLCVCVTVRERERGLKKKDRVLSEAAKPSLAAGIFDGGNQ